MDGGRWVEVVFNYIRDGAVAGQDEAMIGTEFCLDSSC